MTKIHLQPKPKDPNRLPSVEELLNEAAELIGQLDSVATVNALTKLVEAIAAVNRDAIFYRTQGRK